ncbi:hypothetical protein ACLOJK_031713 [Asimina triloba]
MKIFIATNLLLPKLKLVAVDEKTIRRSSSFCDLRQISVDAGTTLTANTTVQEEAISSGSVIVVVASCDDTDSSIPKAKTH